MLIIEQIRQHWIKSINVDTTVEMISSELLIM